jgi:hypothetical protein
VPPATHEFELGKQQADGALESRVKHVVFSSLEYVSSLTGGKKFAPHFTDKARVEEYIRSSPIQCAFVYLAFFYTNLLFWLAHFCLPQEWFWESRSASPLNPPDELTSSHALIHLSPPILLAR